MGGGQTIAIGFRHLDLFSAIGAFSAAIPGDFEKEFAQTIANRQGVNAKLKLFWFACGKQDSLFERSQKFSDLLDARQIKHTFRPSEGAHVYKVWRLYLSEFAPLYSASVSSAGRQPAADWQSASCTQLVIDPSGRK